MDDKELRGIVIEALQQVAPEVGADDLRGDVPLRRQVDLDSLDWLGFLVGLHDRLHVEIPETDYPRLVSLDDVVAYLRDRLPAG
ncbi:acyl carrier protein [Raineyella sp.]|uniref:Carrier domain-containing protein n=1 Tax=bioreactor metagenome TaxID=1076179 RepID=A0A645F3G4_9ZZZZ|nr:acyl carrier protein [Raineyella sp.]MEA5153472.1 acyl carrier protein [Raineyella sp.]